MGMVDYLTISTLFPVLHIQRVHSGIYEWLITLGGHVLAQDDGLASIAECLKQALHGFSEDTHAVEIRYRGIGIGTFPIQALQAAPSIFADKIIMLFSEVMDNRM